jgi:hypothetical protein
MESEELIKLLIFVVVLAVVIGGVVALLSGRGGELLDGLRRSMRTG